MAIDVVHLDEESEAFTQHRDAPILLVDPAAAERRR
jgi:hypothetical protein